MLPFASVIVPTYNGRTLLATCLDALRGQTYPADRWEAIVVDDASSDGTVEYLRATYPEVRVLALAQNSGFIAACNAGVAAARGEVLVLLNNDTEAEPGWLEALVAALVEHPEAGSAASKILLFDRRDTLHTAGDLMGRDGIPRNRGVWEVDRGQYDDQRWVFGACGGAAAYRRAAWEQAGGFDPRLWMYLEDVDLAWRLQLLGWRCIYAPQARVYHQLSATGGGKLASFYTGRNTLWVIARNWPGPLLRRHWPAIVRAQLRIAGDALRAWRGEAARARLRGQLVGLLTWPTVWPQRRAIQATRRASLEDLESLLTPS
ncbi:MAG: glycosyltransferase family 2 protein [Caldilineales bacterium]|nr:glycosyltransferase family 2 protein [Caldilineales bacterium]MDW8316784.1 glycosyltransferase family 2 protein [Anaerolineae bacterium]